MMKILKKVMVSILVATMTITVIQPAVRPVCVQAATKSTKALRVRATSVVDPSDYKYFDCRVKGGVDISTKVKKVSTSKYKVTMTDGEGAKAHFNFKYSEGDKIIVKNAKDNKYIDFTISKEFNSVNIASKADCLKKGKSYKQTITVGLVPKGKAYKWSSVKKSTTIEISMRRAPRKYETGLALLKSFGYKDSLTDLEKYLFIRLVIGDHMEYTEHTDWRYAIVSGEGGVCAEFAEVFDYLCEIVGLNTRKVGYEHYWGARHAINVCKLDGKWYLTDLSMLCDYNLDAGYLLIGSNYYNEISVITKEINFLKGMEDVKLSDKSVRIPSKYLFGDTNIINPDSVGYVQDKKCAKRLADELYECVIDKLYTSDWDIYETFVSRHTDILTLEARPEKLIYTEVDENGRITYVDKATEEEIKKERWKNEDTSDGEWVVLDPDE